MNSQPTNPHQYIYPFTITSNSASTFSYSTLHYLMLHARLHSHMQTDSIYLSCHWGPTNPCRNISNPRQDAKIVSKWRSSPFFKTNLQSNFQINLSVYFKPWSLKTTYLDYLKYIKVLEYHSNIHFHTWKKKGQSA